MVNSATIADRQGQDTNCKVRLLCDHIPTSEGFPRGSAGKESACNVGDLGWEGPLEKRMATHSSILTWRIPWTV